MSPACLDELMKAQAPKFSRLHRLDQLIQCRAQQMNSAHVFNGQFVKKNNILCYAHGNDCYNYKSMSWCGKSLFPVQRETRDMKRRRKQLEYRAVVDGFIESKRLKFERQEERLDENKTLLWIDKLKASLETKSVVPDWARSYQSSRHCAKSCNSNNMPSHVALGPVLHPSFQVNYHFSLKILLKLLVLVS